MLTVVLKYIIEYLPYFHFIKNTYHYQNPNKFNFWFIQKVLGINRKAYWPVHYTSVINIVENITIGIDTAPGRAAGCYIQGLGKVNIGNYTQIAQNVGIVSGNHTIYDLRVLDKSKADVKIGSYCWLGMNAVVLPGVVLGDFTIVGAGAVVTKSFESGHCVIAGNPAKIVKMLDKEKCLRYELPIKYVGYIREEKFSQYKNKYLWP